MNNVEDIIKSIGPSNDEAEEWDFVDGRKFSKGNSEKDLAHETKSSRKKFTNLHCTIKFQNAHNRHK